MIDKENFKLSIIIPCYNEQDNLPLLLKKLLKIMQSDETTLKSNLRRLKKEIYNFTKDQDFLKSKSMGDVMSAALNFVRLNYEKVNMQDFF